MRTVEVYRLWPDGTWDKVEVAISDREPFTFASVELRAVERAWMQLTGRTSDRKPLQIGLYMPSYDTANMPS